MERLITLTGIRKLILTYLDKMKLIYNVILYVLLSQLALAQIANSYSEYSELLRVNSDSGVIITHEDTKKILVAHVNEKRIKYLLASSSPEYTLEQVVATGQIDSPKICGDILKLLNEKDKFFSELPERDRELIDSSTGGGALSVITKDNKLVVLNVVYLYSLQQLGDITLEVDLKPYVQLYLVMARIFPSFMKEFYDSNLITVLSEKTRAEDLVFRSFAVPPPTKQKPTKKISK